VREGEEKFTQEMLLTSADLKAHSHWFREGGAVSASGETGWANMKNFSLMKGAEGSAPLAEKGGEKFKV